MKKQERNKGITLIALVITIIVLLILAAVSIATLTGENGILVRADQTQKRTVHGAVYEQLKLEAAEYVTELKTGEYKGTLISYLIANHIVEQMEGIEGYVVKMSELMTDKQPYGNGTDGETDVYKLKESSVGTGKINQEIASTKTVKIAEATTEEEYDLIYYDKKGEQTNIGKILADGTSTVAGGTGTGGGTGGTGGSEVGDSREHYKNLDVQPLDQKYFTYTVSTEGATGEYAGTATLTGVKDEYAKKKYYDGNYFVLGIQDGETTISDLVIPYELTDVDGKKYIIREVASTFLRERETYYANSNLETWNWKSVIFPNTITVIGNYLLQGFDSIEKITLCDCPVNIRRMCF